VRSNTERACSHRIPLGNLKWLSEKREWELAAGLGGVLLEATRGAERTGGADTGRPGMAGQRCW
jgi:hypothetical protein